MWRPELNSRVVNRSVGLILAAAILLGQAPVSSRLQFEVASIRPHPSDDRRIALGSPSPGRFLAVGATLKNLVMVAYEVGDFQISDAASWMSSDRYNIEAKTEAGSGSKWKECLQSLLEDRFKLKIHRMTKEMPVYAIVIGRRGPKLKESEGECIAAASPRPSPDPGKLPPPICGIDGIWNHLSGPHISMDELAHALSLDLGRTVIDRTGLTGRFDIHLEWTPDQSQTWILPFAPPPLGDGSAPSIYTVIEEQLGLKLESQKGPVEVLVVDHAEQPSAN